MKRKEWFEKIREKKIVLFGCGKTAEEFYKKHLNNCELEVSFCYSNYDNEQEFIVQGKKIADVERPKPPNKSDHIFIIICSISFYEIAEQLANLGYTPFEDFITSSFFEVMVSPKKIAVAYGICQLEGVTECLKKSEMFMDKYNIYYYKSYRSEYYLETERLYLITLCDLFLYTKRFRQTEQIKMRGILSQLEKTCVIIGLPIVTFSGYFFKEDKRIDILNPYAVVSRINPSGPFKFGDEYINRLIDQKCSLDEIYEKVLVYHMNDEELIRNKCAKELLKIQSADNNADVSISEYIEHTYKKQRLFRNEIHIENAIAIEFARLICEKLQIEFIIENICQPLMKHSQHIIYPSIHKALQLEWNWENTKYDLYTHNGWKKVDFFEFIRLYVQYCSNIKELIECGFIPVEDEKFVDAQRLKE